MVIDIDKVIVKDRIRKDFGDIQELADDIKQNGLINPPVVNKNYELLAGERRLRACKSLGWKQIEVRMMDTRDAEHELNVEISENENRKAFSKAERVDYMRRLMRIESAKAEERMKTGVKGPTQKSAEGETRKIVAEQFGISHDTMKKEMEIVDHQDALTPEDFADWDEGKLSTNKAFRKMKERLEMQELRVMQLESLKAKDEGEIRSAKEKAKKAKEQLEKEKAKSEKLASEISGLREELEEATALAFEPVSQEKTPMAELTDRIGGFEMSALIEASRSGKVIVIENDMDGNVAELASMMGIRTYCKGDIFTLTLKDE